MIITKSSKGFTARGNSNGEAWTAHGATLSECFTNGFSLLLDKALTQQTNLIQYPHKQRFKHNQP